MKRFARWPFLAALLVATCALASVKLLDSAGTNTATIDANGNLRVTTGTSTKATYTCIATGLTTTSLYSMELHSESGRGFKVLRVCVGTSGATAAALQTITVQRRTAASSGGSGAVSEGTSSPAVTAHAPGGSAWSGLCTITPTLGTAGAVVDGWGQMVGTLTAPNMSTCRDYGDVGMQTLAVSSGTANGLSVTASSVGAGGLAAGSIAITFIAE